MKQILSQRYIYKLNSSFLLRNKWSVRLTDINDGIKNRFITGLSDSGALRIIRDIINSPYTEEYIKDVKDNLFKTKKNKDNLPSKLLKKRIKELNKERYKSMLETCVCNVDFSSSNGFSEKQYNYAVENGFYINGEKYVLLLGTTGGVKNNCVLFIKESVHTELWRRMLNGADLSVPMLPSKLMAYLALCFSASIPATNGRILVVKDVEVKIKAPVTYVKFNKETHEPIIKHIEDYEMINNVCDGCGILSPEMAEQWAKDLQLDYIASGYCCRNSYVKGMLIKFDFKKYCKEVLKVTVIKDVWGQEHNIDDIDIILNESMLKLSKSYKSIDHYVQCCKENGHGFAVTKAVPKVLENERAMNYQYLQCLDLTDEEIDDLLKDNIQEIKDVMGMDYRKAILYSRGLDLNDKNAFSDSKDNLYTNALMIDGEKAMQDEYIKYRIKKSISKRISQLKTGKIRVKGNYQISCGDIVALLENACGLEPKGLLRKGEFYAEYWREKGVKQVGSFRSPMSCKENAMVMNVCDREEVIKWYGNIKNLIIFNPWDTAMSRLNGQDHDGDMDFTTSNEIIVKGIQDLPAIVCEDESGKKKSNPTREDFIESIKRSFGNPVGSVTNFGSSNYPLLDMYEKESREYKEIDNRIITTQFLQQSVIDSVKTGIKSEKIPDYWNNYHSSKLQYRINKETGEILNTKEEIEEIDFLRKLVVDKKPYYFRYIYSSLDKEYRDYIKKSNSTCRKTFRVTVDELKSKLTKDENEIEFLEAYNRKLPLNINPSVVNKIAWKVEKEFDLPITRDKKSEFDYSIYQEQGNTSIATSAEKKKIKEIYEEYKSKSGQCNMVEYNNKEDSLSDVIDRDEMFKSNMYEILPDKQILLNTLLDMSYNKSTISRGITWLIMGDLMVENMLNNNGRIIYYPTKDKDGDIEYKSFRFKMVEKTIDERN